MITLDLSKAKLAEDLGSYKEKVAEIHDMIRNKTGLNYQKTMTKKKFN